MSEELIKQRVTFVPNPLNNGEYIPQIESDGSVIEFTGDHMDQVLDFENLPEPPPPDAPHRHLEFEFDDYQTMTPHFPKRYFCLRGSFIFYFDMKDVDGNVYNHEGVKFNGLPKGVIPLERTVVEIPPGGRRVFREHSNTEARNGYEIMIRHVGRGGLSSLDSPGGDLSTVTTKRRAPAYIILDSLGQRDAWAKAIRTRADIHKRDTVLRAAGVQARMKVNRNTDDVVAPGNPFAKSGKGRNIGGAISVLAGIIEHKEQRDIDDAIEEFGNRALFEESEWLNDYFKFHDEAEAFVLTSKLEQWQSSIKKGLRGVVLEQYEYFVEASREMSIMGREVTNLKELVSKQNEIIDSLSKLDIAVDIQIRDDAAVDVEDENAFNSDSDTEGINEKKLFKRPSNISDLSNSSPTTVSRKIGPNVSMNGVIEIEIPSWLNDSLEETDTFINNACYSDAVELILKAKTEITELLSLSDKLTDRKLSPKQVVVVQRMESELSDFGNKISILLMEGLRRKNESFKQLLKKDRSDPSNLMSPIVSPTALSDDFIALGLLVKLGRASDAALAYSTRRSLLLNECLHERPIVNSNLSNSLDVVIYAAQLSHSYFSCMSQAVEGFIDLFAENKTSSTDDGSIDSSIKTSGINGIPSNALATICLWCDSELLKFSSAFGTKVLDNLSLYPKDTNSNGITSKIMKFETSADINHLKEQLRAAEERGEYAAASKLRKKLAVQEQEDNEGNLSHKASSKGSLDKERKVAIEIAAKCIEQALDFSTEFLNSIGLPLAPRLAEYLRTRLKGCEAEIAIELEDRWDQVLFEWKHPSLFKPFDLPSPGVMMDPTGRKNFCFSDDGTDI